MSTTPLNTLWQDSFKALTGWRIWWFLGLLDVKNRFRRSILGPVWVFLSLGLTIAGAGLVYGMLFNQTLSDFLPMLAAGVVTWNFIVGTLTEGGFAFANAENYIKQFSHPKQVYLLRAFVSQAVVLMIGLLAVILVLFSLRGPGIINIILAIPGLIILLIAGLAHITLSSYITTRVRDFPHACGAALQVLFFITPIIVPVSALKEHNLQLVYQLNPIHYLMDVVRGPMLTSHLAVPESYLFSGLYACAAWLVAFLVARQLDSRIVFLL